MVAFSGIYAKIMRNYDQRNEERHLKILIMIPAYNEAENIKRVVDNLIENYPEYDYVVINDGSTDDTRKICARNHYNLLDLPVNTGLSGAIKVECAMRIIMDMTE